MSEQVKRYKLGKNFYSAIVAGDRDFVLATDYDALRAEAEALRVALLEIASANPAERGIEWAKSYASDGLKGSGSELYARWLDTFKEAEALRAENAKLRTALAEQGERQEAVHWRALLHPDQRPQQLHDKHVVGFTTRESAEAWVAEKKDFQGWDYSIEPLYTTPQPVPDVRALVEALELWLADYDKVAANPDFEPFPHIAEFVDKSRAALATYHQDT